MPAADPLHEVLDSDECRRLLSTTSVGRLAYTEGALPLIVPLAYAVHDDHVVVVADRRGSLASALRGAVVAFGIDSWEGRTHTGWSVNVIGPTRVVRAGDEVERLDSLAVPGPAASVRCYVLVRIQLLHGWRTAAPGRSEGEPASRHAG